MNSKLLLTAGLTCTATFPATLYAQGPDLMLAQPYQQIDALADYWISEKYDGMRAYWDGKNLLSRSGHIIAAPPWFTQDWPSHPLDGELWIKRGQFQQLMSIVRDKTPDEIQWRKVRYLVFDRPDLASPFNLRYQTLELTINSLNKSWVQRVKQQPVASHRELAEQLQHVLSLGGEGLMLRQHASHYQAGRTDTLLKLKPKWDDEAVVIAYEQGQGRLAGLVGALVVQDPQGRQFKLGSGLTDEQRRNPPPLGSLITYSYSGRTDSGLPRFARFERIFAGF